jgi:hypothetical protein
MFQRIYDSPLHNPASFWLAAIVFLVWWARARAFLTGFVAVFVVEIMADALASGGWAPEALRGSALATPLSIAFVILGDFRYFLLVERFARRPGARPDDATSRAAWAGAAALSLLVPVASAVAGRVVPGTSLRWTFLTYEVMFAVLAVALRAFVLPRRLAACPAPVRGWLLRVTTFEIVQYALWALADLIILAGADAGFALRLVPNAMYYALFLPFVVATVPAEQRA